jgi:hypothetical protein
LGVEEEHPHAHKLFNSAIALTVQLKAEWGALCGIDHQAVRALLFEKLWDLPSRKNLLSTEYIGASLK